MIESHRSDGTCKLEAREVARDAAANPMARRRGFRYSPVMMRKVGLLLLVSMLTACVGGGSVAKVEDAAAGGGSLLEMINRLRVSEGLQPVVPDALLTKLALDHSRDMARRGELTHYGADGTGYEQRLMAAGLSRTASLTAGENVAHSPDPGGAARAFRRWGESGMHRRNFLQREHDKIGIGEVDGYWTVILAQPSL